MHTFVSPYTHPSTMPYATAHTYTDMHRQAHKPCSCRKRPIRADDSGDRAGEVVWGQRITVALQPGHTHAATDKPARRVNSCTSSQARIDWSFRSELREDNEDI